MNTKGRKLTSLAVAVLSALLLVWPAEHSRAADVTVTFDAVTGHNEPVTATRTCSGDVCSIPAIVPDFIPFPELTLTTDIRVANGQLRGVMGVDIDSRASRTPLMNGTLRGTVTFSAVASAHLVLGAPTVLTELGLVGITSDAYMHNASAAQSLCVSHECDLQQVKTKVQISIIRGNGEVGSFVDLQNSVKANMNTPAASSEFTEPVSLSMPFEETFGLAWTFETSLEFHSLNDRGVYSLRNDFSATLGFTGLHFYDADGNDVSQWVEVSFDTPIAFLDTPAAPVPEPATYAMLVAGLGLLGVAARRRNSKRQGRFRSSD